jgi:recombination protein RecR
MTKNYLPKELIRLVESFSKLPGIGQATASRLALYLMRKPSDLSLEIAKSLIEARKKVKSCPNCNNFMFDNDCSCSDSSRQSDILCIVENTVDVISVENSGEYNGQYHVLQGLLSISQGINPKDLKINQLINRIKNSEFKEIILATDPTSDGEFTAQYIHEKIKPYCLLITRIAIGVPIGSEVNYIDKNTLAKSIVDRRKIG